MNIQKNTNEGFLGSILENLPHMVFIKEAKTLTFVLLNKRATEIIGYPKEQLLGKSDYDFFDKKEADFFTETDRKVLAGKEVVEIPEESLHTKNGTIWLNTKKVPLFDNNGHPTHILGIAVDITEKKKLKEELAALNKDLEQRVQERTKELEEKNKELEQINKLMVG